MRTGESRRLRSRAHGCSDSRRVARLHAISGCSFRRIVSFCPRTGASGKLPSNRRHTAAVSTRSQAAARPGADRAMLCRRDARFPPMDPRASPAERTRRCQRRRDSPLTGRWVKACASARPGTPQRPSFRASCVAESSRRSSRNPAGWSDTSLPTTRPDRSTIRLHASAGESAGVPLPGTESGCPGDLVRPSHRLPSPSPRHRSPNTLPS